MIASTDPPRAAAGRDEASSDHLDPAHALYHHAAGVLASAQAVDAASHAAGAVAAVAPTLACLDTGLAALAAATERLRAQALTRLAEPLFEADERRRERAELSASFERLAGVLAQASIAAEQALAATDPVLDELTV
ncbi:hypothetical protein [Solirubrobacter pauli]|uniref:hypothetical protein n=1 Tax=Solirubrobacter pauli TaxID=166793 RepID=UPI0011C3CBC2|nr:hypothetical protein [Solirubrobacter pauli]